MFIIVATFLFLFSGCATTHQSEVSYVFAGVTKAKILKNQNNVLKVKTRNGIRKCSNCGFEPLEEYKKGVIILVHKYPVPFYR